MSRNLDIASLRSLVAIADAKGVTRAAERINLSQSAVSMQIRRLEDAFGSKLLMRQGRGVVLTPNGEQLVSYARRLVRLNDEAWLRLTTDELEGELRFGVPADIVYPHVPYVLRQAREAYPRIKITLVSDVTLGLKEQLDHGALDLILTTERRLEAGGETLLEAPLQWVGKNGGTAHLRRPLPMALCANCALKPDLLTSLDSAGIPWEITAETDSDAAVDATVAADLAIKPVVGTHYGPNQSPIPATSLPLLAPVQVNLYTSENVLVVKLAELVRVAYSMSVQELGEAELIEQKASGFR